MTADISTGTEISADQIKTEMQKLEVLRQALIQGEKSGIAEDYSVEAVQRQLDREFEAQ